MNPRVISAIFRRNFVSYFSNPTGYVFICVFVLLGSFAAFWPEEFFSTNLASLHQLNAYFPYIMLVFIPAITMSIWAEEKRQGTDELLLTIPATDIDVVLGKYLAAVAIYTVALGFSLVCNLGILARLGQPDFGLFIGTYFGYWMVGLAMLAIGMVASFLTGNLTVAFILGVVFNAPLVFLNVVDNVVRGGDWTNLAKGWSIGEQMSDFGRGVISLSSIIYFVMITVAMLYLCMVLIGRRHWLGGKDGKSMGPHYLVRALSLILLAVGVIIFAQDHSPRLDVTAERLNSLSPETKKLIAGIDPKYPVVIEAYVSPRVPKEYVQTRLDLLNLLREFEKLSNGKITAKIFADVEPRTDEAVRAEQQFGIVPQMLPQEGTLKPEEVIMGAAITSGLEKIVIPFFERGIPVEYELTRSVATITQQKRKRLGVLLTDAELFGGFDMSGGMPRQTPRQPLIDELEKQYEVVRVDPASPIVDDFDVLLAVQPSSLPQAAMDNFLAAVKRGVPTAIFEDPLPVAINAPGTRQPRRPRGGMSMFGPPQVEPKGNVEALWDLLGVKPVEKSRKGFFGNVDTDAAIVWQAFKPSPQYEGLANEIVFISNNAPGAVDAFNPTDPITSGLQLACLAFSGGLTAKEAASTDFSPLLKTGTESGTIMVKDMLSSDNDSLALRAAEGAPTGEQYVLAARITGRVKAGLNDKPAEEAKDKDKDKAEDEEKDSAKKSTKDCLNVVLVADIDLLSQAFFVFRSGRLRDTDLQIDSDNITFVLGTLDSLAGDTRFIDIRKRQPQHRPLATIDEQTQRVREEQQKIKNEAIKKTEEQERQLEEDFKKAQDAINAEIARMQREGDVNPRELQQKLIEQGLKVQVEERRKTTTIEELKRKEKRDIEEADLRYAAEVRSVRNRYKLWSVLLPPILPLLVAFFVYFNRRAKEREGVSKARLR